MDVKKIDEPGSFSDTNDEAEQYIQNFHRIHSTTSSSKFNKLGSQINLVPKQDIHQKDVREPSRKRTIRNKKPISFTSLMFLVYMFSLIFGFETKGLIAYDCANPEVNNLTSKEMSIQVLQRNIRSLTTVQQCKVIIRRSIRHCGAFSHTSDYQYGFAYIVKEFNSEECKKVHALGIVSLTHDRVINELKLNSTTRGETLIIGSLIGTSCSGGTYYTPFYTWTDALVYYEYEIALYDYIANIDLENDQIFLRNGLTCTYSIGTCLDSEEGYLTWDVNLNQSK